MICELSIFPSRPSRLRGSFKLSKTRLYNSKLP